jgi:hypothetical protein
MEILPGFLVAEKNRDAANMPRTPVHAQIFAKCATDEFVKERVSQGGQGRIGAVPILGFKSQALYA